MNEATRTPTSAASARNAYGDNQEILILFGLWCRAIKFEPGPEWADRRDEALRDKIDERLNLESSLARVAMLSDVGKSAVIWISVLRLCHRADRANPALPDSSHAEHRRLVLSIAQLHPELAKLAGVTHAEILTKAPHDALPVAVA